MNSIKKLSFLFLLSSLLFACNKPSTDSKDIAKLQEEVEYYIIQKYTPTFHHTREFGALKEFDFNQLFAESATPFTFAHEEYAHTMNKEAFQFISDYMQEHEVAYTLRYDYLTKEEEEGAWDGHWRIILLDKNQNILDDVPIMP